MTLEEYKTELSRHDWSYQYSDDHSVWLRGANNQMLLVNLAEDNGPEWMQAYKDAQAKYK